MLTGILNIGSNDITETNCDNVNAEDLFNKRITLRKNVDYLELTTLQFHPF